MTQPSSRRATVLAAGLLSFALIPGLTQAYATSHVRAGAPSVDLKGLTTPGDPVAGLADFAQQGTAQPLSSQRAAADALGAVRLRWNAVGTPASILPTDGTLGAAPGDAVSGARSWLHNHADLFGLSAGQVDALALVNNQEFASSDARAVLFRQEFGGLPSARGGLVTVGVDDGQVFYVSSSLVRASGTPAPAVLSPRGAWLAAATSVGLGVPSDRVGDIVTTHDPSNSGDWTELGVPGFAQRQQVRPRAFALADGSVRRVFEANVLNAAGGSASAYTVLVDAVTGVALARTNQVENLEDTQTFQGTVTNSACGPVHPFTLTDGATRQINAVAVGAPADDFVVKILDKNGVVLASGDTATNPEVATYSAASIPQDVYGARVCPFDSASIVVGQYSLTVNTTNTAAPDPGSAVPSPRWRHFLTNPTLDSPTETPSNSVIGCWRLPTPAGDCSTPPGQLENIAAFGPWDAQGSVPTFTTIGNNANTHEAWASPLTPGGTAQAPYSPTRSYTQEFTDAWNNSQCDPQQLRPSGNDINASVTNLFASHNHMHDYSYYLGFTERNYNMQNDNGGRGGVSGDAEVGNAQAGAVSGGSPGMYRGRDNANQITMQDGTPGITNQYLFQPIAGGFYAPCTDGGLDMGIVGHEYTHAISGRMIGGPDEGITSEQGGAMGESWSDLVAGEYQFSHGYSNGGNIWAIGAYATGNLDTAIRDYAINDNPLNFSQYGFDTPGPEVHADGEIWNGTMWEVRQALVEKYDAQYPYADKALQLRCAQATSTETPRSVETCPGNRRWVQLIFDSFLLQQGATSMVDARDAMLAADQGRFGGVDTATMWAAFARRGLGAGAATTADSDEPTPSFATPTGPNSTVTFRSAGAAKIYVGDYEARVTPIADTDPASALGVAAAFTPGTYAMTAVSPDHGFTKFTLTVTDGAARTVTIADDVNVASAAAGATVIGPDTDGSRNADYLIDGTENTTWGGVVAPDDSVDVTHPQVAIDLAGGLQTVRRVNVSAYLVPAPPDPTDAPLFAGQAGEPDPDSGSRFTALRQFALESCTADCASPNATWSRFYTSPADAFPSVRPRPVAPTLRLREFDVPDTEAAAVRLVALENQCTGFDGYAGELDNDPTNSTDCKAASSRDTIVHAAELQVFATAGSPTTSTGGTTPPPSTPGTPGTPATPGTPSTPGTPGTTPPSGSERIGTRLKVRVFRAVQTPANAAPQLRIRLRVAGPRVERLGTFVVKLDGHRYTKQTVTGRSLKMRVTRPLAPGKHRVRVFFRPFDRGAYAPSKSARMKILVRR